MGELQAEHANTHQLYELVQLLDSLDEEYLVGRRLILKILLIISDK
jgi:hypothetical protein